MLTKMTASRKVENEPEMKKPIKIDCGKLGLEIIAGGPINIDENGLDLSHLEIALDGKLKYGPKEDLLVHIQYFPEENRYGFILYKKAENLRDRPPSLRTIIEKVANSGNRPQRRDSLW